ncbi:glycosyltransferase [Jiangella mangrovi]|uniref:Glycosyltransferase involved in cell wall biosynthesis n=1 Tax=Jiangella mangrovi TaxID=1524084 RepID=A0A7W9GRK4_9ACTN|nr:glycosyltransferase [Jiangella mangrovi]MBB5788436.1 glycosyltransferase involved in cell wall biosynthesis [Jiangella mangrovi]
MKLPVGRVRRLVKKVLPQAYLDDVARRRRIAAAIRASGLFDEAWYREQLDAPIPPGVDPVDHYVTLGSATDVSPNPCFVSEWYRDHPDSPKKLDVAPFVHYVNRGIARGLSPHPLFDPAFYTEQHPGAADHRGGPLGHYLETGWKTGAQPSAAFDVEVYTTTVGDVQGPPLADFARRTRRLMLETRGWEHLPRTADTFDHDAAQAFKRDVLAAYAQLREEPPLVTVVIPTKDRREGVLAAIDSVLAQSYRTWQLIVVDDGSTDGTAEAVEALDDERIELIRREQAGGVSAARNAGLAQARGDYVAYLDSDNLWEHDFLEVMVAFVRSRSLRFGYAVSELVEEKKNGRTGYRSLQFNREALVERNFIDCIVVLHERSLLDEVGTFDEHLRRNVDWDLFIRMSAVTDFELAPFIATRYDAWEERSDRITINELFGYRFVIRAKHLIDWDAVDAGLSSRAAGSVSVVIHAGNDAHEVTGTVERLLEVTESDVEVVVVDAKASEAEAMRLQFLPIRFPRVRVLRQTQRLSTELSRTIGAAQATGETIVFLPPDAWVEEGWLEPLTAALADGAAAVQPQVLLRDGTVWSAGVAFARGAHPHNLYRRFPGDAPEAVAPSTPSGLSPLALAVRAADFAAVRGFEPLFVNDIDNADLSLRLARQTGRPLRYEPGALVALTETPERRTTASATTTATDNQELFTGRWKDTVGQDDVAVWGGHGYTIVGYDGEAPTHWGFDPIVVRDRAQRPLRWAIKIGAPDVTRRTNWGDWHYAIGLKEALERLGHEAVIDSKRAWYRPTSRFDDVALVLRGVSVYTVNPQQINLSWVISHPERVTRRELASYDAVFAASTRLARRMSTDLGAPVRPLLQATDAHRFRPVPPDPRRRHDVLFVGNARGMRASVGAALAAGIVPSVYGVRWRGLLPEGAWLGEYLPNEDLPAVYAGAGVVLNDHWEDMKAEGLMSNRLFDLAACGARVVTDVVPGVDEVFGDVVLTYTTPQELAAAVNAQLAETPERAAAREKLSELVRREHSFDARAEELVETVRKLHAEREAAH